MEKTKILCPNCNHKPFKNETNLAWHLEHVHGKVTEDKAKSNGQNSPEGAAKQDSGALLEEPEQKSSPVIMSELERLFKGEPENKGDFGKQIVEGEGKPPEPDVNQEQQSENIKSNLASSKNNVANDELERLLKGESLNSNPSEESTAKLKECEAKLNDAENRIGDLTADNASLEEELRIAREALFSPENQRAALNDALANGMMTHENWLELGRRLGFPVPEEDEKKEEKPVEPVRTRVVIKVGNKLYPVVE